MFSLVKIPVHVGTGQVKRFPFTKGCHGPPISEVMMEIVNECLRGNLTLIVDPTPVPVRCDVLLKPAISCCYGHINHNKFKELIKHATCFMGLSS